MKKWFIILLTLLIVLAFSGCTSQESKPSSSTPSPTPNSPASTNKEEPSALNYPVSTLTAIMGYGAGGNTDSALRPLFAEIEKIIGQSIIVQNVTGGSGSIAFEQAAQSPADGYTLNVSAECGAFYDAYDLIDYTYMNQKMIMVVCDAPSLIFVSADSPYNTIQEMFEAELAKPGTVIKVASAVGVNNTLGQLWDHTLGVNIAAVSAESGSTTITTVLGGFADFGVSAASTLYDYYQSGQIKILATCDNVCDPRLPDVPALGELYPEMAEYLPMSAYYCVCLPKDTPQEIVDYLVSAFEKAYASDAYQQTLSNLMLNGLGLTGQDAYNYIDAWRHNALSVLTLTGEINYSMSELGY